MKQVGNSLVIVVGVSGSGKSTVAKTSYKNDLIISSDEIREELTGNQEDKTRNEEVFDIFYKRIMDGLKNGETVVADATNTYKPSREMLYKIAQSQNVPVDILLLNVTLEQCLKQNFNIKRHVPDNVIRKQFDRYAKAREDIVEEEREGKIRNIYEIILPNKEQMELGE